METLLTILLVLYVIGGAVTYMLADARGMASKLESSSPAVTLAMANSAVFAAIMALWPAWWFFVGRERSGPLR